MREVVRSSCEMVRSSCAFGADGGCGVPGLPRDCFCAVARLAIIFGVAGIVGVVPLSCALR